MYIGRRRAEESGDSLLSIPRQINAMDFPYNDDTGRCVEFSFSFLPESVMFLLLLKKTKQG